jgi:hypothetical protein
LTQTPIQSPALKTKFWRWQKNVGLWTMYAATLSLSISQTHV